MDSLAPSYLSATFSLPGSAVEAAAARKRSKYAAITLIHILVPVKVETLGPANAVGSPSSESNWRQALCRYRSPTRFVLLISKAISARSTL